MVGDGPTVQICICTRSAPSMEAIKAATIAADTFGAATLRVEPFSYGVAECRNRAVNAFLQSSATHLLMIDDDVTVQADVCERLLALDCEIASGCVPTCRDIDPAKTPFLAVADRRRDDRNYIFRTRWFRDVIDCVVVGAACVMIRRDVFEVLGFPWFRWSESRSDDGRIDGRGEDLDFCERATAAGMRIRADGMVRCGHYRRIDFASCIPEYGRAMISEWRGPRTATERDAIIRYGSHLPVLAEIGAHFSIRSALEFGAGECSTGAFLNQQLFPDLVVLNSFESDPRWINRVRGIFAHDSRLRLHLCDYVGALDKAIATISEPPDVILIDGAAPPPTWRDDGTYEADYSVRIKQFRRFEEMQNVIVVLHDAQYPTLAAAVNESSYDQKGVLDFGDGSPATAVAANGYDLRPMFGREG